jgi:uncharacterized glyoxalase superfamily protein PhnB
MDTTTATPVTTAPTVWPSFRCRDARRLIRFLVTAFGFEETLVVPGDREDVVVHAELRWPAGGGGVMLGSQGVPEGDEHAGLPSGPVAIYVVTDDPDALLARATTAGAQVLHGLHDTDHGSRDFAVVDPEGNHWYFGTYRGAEPAA